MVVKAGSRTLKQSTTFQAKENGEVSRARERLFMMLCQGQRTAKIGNPLADGQKGGALARPSLQAAP